VSFWAWDKEGRAHWFPLDLKRRTGSLTAWDREQIRVAGASCGFNGPRMLVTRPEADEIRRDHAEICDTCLLVFEAETNTLIRHARSPHPAYRIAHPHEPQERGI